MSSPGLLRYSSEGRLLETVRFVDDLPSNALVALTPADMSPFTEEALEVLRGLPAAA